MPLEPFWQKIRDGLPPAKRDAFDERVAICAEQPDVTEEQACMTAYEEVRG